MPPRTNAGIGNDVEPTIFVGQHYEKDGKIGGRGASAKDYETLRKQRQQRKLASANLFSDLGNSNSRSRGEPTSEEVEILLNEANKVAGSLLLNKANKVAESSARTAGRRRSNEYSARDATGRRRSSSMGRQKLSGDKNISSSRERRNERRPSTSGAAHISSASHVHLRPARRSKSIGHGPQSSKSDSTSRYSEEHQQQQQQQYNQSPHYSLNDTQDNSLSRAGSIRRASMDDCTTTRDRDDEPASSLSFCRSSRSVVIGSNRRASMEQSTTAFGSSASRDGGVEALRRSLSSTSLGVNSCRQSLDRNNGHNDAPSSKEPPLSQDSTTDSRTSHKYISTPHANSSGNNNASNNTRSGWGNIGGSMLQKVRQSTLRRSSLDHVQPNTSSSTSFRDHQRKSSLGEGSRVIGAAITDISKSFLREKSATGSAFSSTSVRAFVSDVKKFDDDDGPSASARKSTAASRNRASSLFSSFVSSLDQEESFIASSSASFSVRRPSNQSQNGQCSSAASFSVRRRSPSFATDDASSKPKHRQSLPGDAVLNKSDAVECRKSRWNFLIGEEATPTIMKRAISLPKEYPTAPSIPFHRNSGCAAIPESSTRYEVDTNFEPHTAPLTRTARRQTRQSAAERGSILERFISDGVRNRIDDEANHGECHSNGARVISDKTSNDILEAYAEAAKVMTVPSKSADTKREDMQVFSPDDSKDDLAKDLWDSDTFQVVDGFITLSHPTDDGKEGHPWM